MDVMQNKKQLDTSYTDEDLFVLMSYKEENEAEAKDAFRIFYERYKNLLWSLCYGVCAKLDIENGAELAQDVFSNTMMTIYAHPTYDSKKSKLSTWMSKIAYNETLDLIKEYNLNDRKNIPLKEDVITSTSDIEDDIVDYETPQKKILNDALSLLSERDREILLTCFLYQEENKHLPDEVLSELSNRYSTTPANIRQIKKRALDKIKAHIIQNSTCQTIKS